MVKYRQQQKRKSRRDCNFHRGSFFSLFPFSLVFPAGLRWGRWVWNVFSDRKYWLSLYFLVLVCFSSKALNPPQKSVSEGVTTAGVSSSWGGVCCKFRKFFTAEPDRAGLKFVWGGCELIRGGRERFIYFGRWKLIQCGKNNMDCSADFVFLPMSKNVTYTVIMYQ